MIHANEAVKLSGIDKALEEIEQKIILASRDGSTECTFRLGDYVTQADAIVSKLKSNGYLAYWTAGCMSQRSVKPFIRISWNRDTSKPVGFWESVFNHF